MRAYHMPSLPEMPLENAHTGITDLKQMKLKILYSLDDNNFLARSLRLSQVKTARIPIPGQQNIMTLGVVSIKDALEPVFNSSPELFSDSNWDYSVYVKDISEEDEPFVGHGLISKLANEFDEELLVPGRVCSNFAALLSNKSSSETLEIKLRLAKVKRIDYPQAPIPAPSQQQQQIQEQQHSTQSKINIKKPYRRSSLSQQQKNQKDSSDTENEFEEEQPKFVEPKHPQQLPKMTRFVNNAPAPKAARTQSLPVFENMMKPPSGKPIETFPVDSIPLRIYMADKNGKNNSNNSKSNGNLEYNQASVAKRFSSDFIKSNNTNNNNNLSLSSKKKQKKNSYVSPVNNRNKIPEEHQLYQSCFNCKTLEAKGWKWNESEDLSKRGLLCSLCYTYLRDKGVMRPKRLFTKTTKPKEKKNHSHTSSSSPGSNIDNDTTPATTPIRFPMNVNSKNNNELPSSSYLDNSSDPLNGFDDMINDLDFQYGPLTDIDPLPPQNHFDKENIPPPPKQQTTSIAAQLQEYHEQRSKLQQQREQKQQLQQQLKPQHQTLLQQQQQQQLIPQIHQIHQPSPQKASKQTSFEKMLTKSFSGVLPSTNTGLSSPSEWMNTFFEESQQEPTPKDQTPKDDSPKDITTCNTLPCNEEYEEENEILTPGVRVGIRVNGNNVEDLKNNGNNSENTKTKTIPTMPSSPFLNSQEHELNGDIGHRIKGSSSPNKS